MVINESAILKTGLKNKKSFPEHLIDILSYDRKATFDSIAWSTHGKTFVITNPEKFVKQVLPQLFDKKNKNSSSFFTTIEILGLQMYKGWSREGGIFSFIILS